MPDHPYMSARKAGSREYANVTLSPRSGSVDDEDEEPNTKVQLQQDCYGFLAYAVVCICDTGTRQARQFWRLCIMAALAGLLLCINLFVQAALLFMLFAYVIEVKRDHMEGKTSQAVERLEEALAMDVPLNTSVPFDNWLVNTCWQDHSVQYSQSLMIFLWALKINGEISNSVWFLRTSLHLPERQGNLIEYDKSRDETKIVGLARVDRCLIIMFVAMPKIVISIGVALIGAKFLMMAESVGVVIMKSVAMAFVILVDELLLTGLVSSKLRARIGRAYFHLYMPEGQFQKELTHWLSTVLKLVGTVTIVLIYTRAVWGELAAFRKLCGEYEAHFQLVPHTVHQWVKSTCIYCGLDIFGMHVNEP